MTEPFHRTPAFRSKLRSLQMMGYTIQHGDWSSDVCSSDLS